MTNVQALWMGSPLTRLEVGAINAAVSTEHTIDIYTYNDISGFLTVSESATGMVTVRDAREILCESEIFSFTGRHAAYSYLPFSDLFRIMLLHKKGGIWIDLDLLLIKPIPRYILDRPYVFASERTIQKGAYKSPTLTTPSICFIKVPGPRSELTLWLLRNLPKTTTAMTYTKLFQKAIKVLNLQEWVLPPEIFCPINWWDVPELFNGKDFRSKYGQPAFSPYDIDKPEVIAIHLWRAILRKKALPYDKNTGLTNYYNLLFDRFC